MLLRYSGVILSDRPLFSNTSAACQQPQLRRICVPSVLTIEKPNRATNADSVLISTPYQLGAVSSFPTQSSDHTADMFLSDSSIVLYVFMYWFGTPLSYDNCGKCRGRINDFFVSAVCKRIHCSLQNLRIVCTSSLLNSGLNQMMTAGSKRMVAPSSCLSWKQVSNNNLPCN